MDLINSAYDRLIAALVIASLILLFHALRVVYFPCQYYGYDGEDRTTHSCIYHSRVQKNFTYGIYADFAKSGWADIHDKEEELRKAAREAKHTPIITYEMELKYITKGCSDAQPGV